VELHPAAVDAYRRAVVNFQSALTSDDKERHEAMDIVRSLVTSIHVSPHKRVAKPPAKTIRRAHELSVL
jgi:hypothetical protein